MGVTASSSSSWSEGLRTGVRSSPSVAVPVPVPAPEFELRGELEVAVVGPAMAAELRGAGRGRGVRAEALLPSETVSVRTVVLYPDGFGGPGPSGRAAEKRESGSGAHLLTPLPHTGSTLLSRKQRSTSSLLYILHHAHVCCPSRPIGERDRRRRGSTPSAQRVNTLTDWTFGAPIYTPPRPEGSLAP